MADTTDLTTVHDADATIDVVERVGSAVLLKVIQRHTRYDARHWDLERANRYVIRSGSRVVEASFFQHYANGVHVKNVIELPTSFGCPVRCGHCASSLLGKAEQLDVDTLLDITTLISQTHRHDLELSPRCLVTFSGIGEGAFQRANLKPASKAIQRLLPDAYFTFTTVGHDPSFVTHIGELAQEVPVHYLQISYLHFDSVELQVVIPRAVALGFDFPALVSTIRASPGVPIRLNYVVIRSYNDSSAHVAHLCRLVDGLQSRIVFRVSRLNETAASRRNQLAPPTREALLMVREGLAESGFEAYVFASSENDNLNCGQLAWDYEGRLSER
jgi:adenine C2-methylase RlmN of 23S rRNA A2503 and tRNA A37